MASDDADIRDLLIELVAWTRFANLDRLTKALEGILRDPKHLAAYEATDGSRSQTQVAQVSGLSQPSVSALWGRWRRLALVVETDGRPRHLIRPSDLGIGAGDTAKY